MRGGVQGVGYRWFAQDAADAAAVEGWVRNRRDGSVEAVLHGEADAVDGVLTVLREGPRHARVDAVEVHPEPDAPATGRGFEIRPSV